MAMKGILGGVLAFVGGIAVGILYAPASGSSTRKRLAKQGRKLGEKATEAAESAGELVEKAKKRIA